MHFLRRVLVPLHVVALVTAALLSGAPTASAAAADTTLLQPGWAVTAATVSCPGQPQRSMTSLQAATFLQSFIADAFFSHLKVQDPPAGVTRCTVTLASIFAGEPPQPASPVGYATNGTKVWVQIPPGKWSVAKQTQRAIDSFAGHGTYVPVANAPTTTPASSPKTTAPATSDSSHGSSTTWIWIVVLAAVVVLALAAVIRSRRRRSATTTAGPPRQT